ncbi:MAG: UDP-N-acetylmuramyl pentapeptide phosphotransferase [Proteobacteria bacterium]|nr:UDP-N-acetylmuramyl pentapeptide phosphotransferase [Pseudomonadota bacterium]
MDRSNDRSSHDGVIPKGGGIGILAAFLFASWVLGLPLLFLISIGLTALVSFYGDRKEIPAKIRLCVQFIAGVALLAGIFHWEGRGWPVYLLIPFFAVFVVGTANYYNFMDGIDGIAGITGIVAFGLIALFGVLSGANEPLVILAGCMGFGCLGFLPFNMPRARVFMGDVGSILLGFVFASMVVWLSKSLLDFLCLSAFMLPFYADELTTLVVRVKDGGRKWEDEGLKCGMDAPVKCATLSHSEFHGVKMNRVAGLMGMLMKPHRRHLYQLLANERGIDHWKVSVGYGVFQLIVGVSVMVVRPVGIWGVLAVLAAWFGGFAGVSFYFRRKLATGL